MTGVKVEIDEAKLAQLLEAPAVGELITLLAGDVAEAVVAVAPVHTGAYRDSIRSRPAELVKGVWRAKVESTDPKAHLVEWGSVNNPPYRPMTAGALAMGLRVEDDG